MSAVCGRYLRPLLGESKEEILQYVAKRGLRYRVDGTNLEKDATRNRIRLDILPLLEDAVPGAKENLIAFGVRAKEDDDYLYTLAKEWVVKTSPAFEGDSGLSVSVDAPPPLFRRACLTVLKTLGVEKDYTQKHLLALQSLCGAQTGTKASLPQGITAVRRYGSVQFCKGVKEEKQQPIPFSFGRFAWENE